MSRRTEAFDRPSPSDGRLLTREEMVRIGDRINGFATGDGSSTVQIDSWWAGELRWARNRVSLTSDRRDIRVSIQRLVSHSVGQAWTNQLDDVSLQAAVHAAERAAQLRPQSRIEDFHPPSPMLPEATPTIWSDATFDATAPMRGTLATSLVSRAEAKGMLSAGFLRMYGSSRGLLQELRGDVAAAGKGTIRYNQFTVGECSMTVRDPKGMGSGWSGLSGFDWAAINGERLADQALEKCLMSLNPVAVEPGRYTVVLEPQAVYDFVLPLVGMTSRGAAESGQGPFVERFDPALRLYRTKLGLKIVDSRVTISHDPNDPLLGVIPEPGLVPIVWIDHGVLTTLTNDRPNHALPLLNENVPSLRRNSFRMSGGTATLDEMIASTERGLLVTRFSGVRLLDGKSVLCSGLTRDGLWLIQNGKISKAVKNMRFRESPLFTLNNLQMLGVPAPIFSAERSEPASAIVPPIKALDFSFTSLADAV